MDGESPLGTHSAGESIVYGIGPDFDGVSLKKILKLWPEFLGTISFTKKYSHELPFLFKLLSIRKPLSIQVHPDKDSAKELCKKFPSF